MGSYNFIAVNNDIETRAFRFARYVDQLPTFRHYFGYYVGLALNKKHIGMCSCGYRKFTLSVRTGIHGKSEIQIDGR